MGNTPVHLLNVLGGSHIPPIPHNFNWAVDSVIQHWMLVVLATEARADGYGRAVQRMVSFFCTGNGLLVSTRTCGCRGVSMS